MTARMDGEHLHQKWFSAIHEAARSDAFRSELEELAKSASIPRPRVGWRPIDVSADELVRRFEEHRALPAPHRPRAQLDSERGDAYGLSHVERHTETCRRLARHYLHSADAWWVVHEEVRAPGAVDLLAKSVSGYPCASGPLASTLAADVSGASWGSMPTGPARARRAFVRENASSYTAFYAAGRPRFQFLKSI